MPKRSPKEDEDAKEIAFRVVRECTADHDEPTPPMKKRKNPAAGVRGRRHAVNAAASR